MPPYLVDPEPLLQITKFWWSFKPVQKQSVRLVSYLRSWRLLKRRCEATLHARSIIPTQIWTQGAGIKRFYTVLNQAALEPRANPPSRSRWCARVPQLAWFQFEFYFHLKSAQRTPTTSPPLLIKFIPRHSSWLSSLLWIPYSHIIQAVAGMTSSAPQAVKKPTEESANLCWCSQSRCCQIQIHCSFFLRAFRRRRPAHAHPTQSQWMAINPQFLFPCPQSETMLDHLFQEVKNTFLLFFFSTGDFTHVIKLNWYMIKFTHW